VEEGIEAGWDIVFSLFRDDIVIVYGIGCVDYYLDVVV
jgi:hypothetical protein